MANDLNITVTGSAGFIGQNLILHLRERGYANIHAISRESCRAERKAAYAASSVIFHLAGVNRPQSAEEFMPGNLLPATELGDALRDSKLHPLVIVASSTKAGDETPYGQSKRKAEEALLAMSDHATVLCYRLSNVFGKWCRPNYNSAVATFCYNLARGIEISINEAAPLTLVYIDDIIGEWLDLLEPNDAQTGVVSPKTVYESTVGEVAGLLRNFAASRLTIELDGVGAGLPRALYSTYLSYLPPDAMSYELKAHTDPRGTFSEMLRTKTTGQFSYFTAHPGITRGGHYHHTKTEKFLVLNGKARFRFRHMLTDETVEILTDGNKPIVVETPPGWSHNVTNIGDDTLICMLWANEKFNPAKPDTVAAKVF